MTSASIVTASPRDVTVAAWAVLALELGRELLDALGIPEGSRILSVNRQLTKDHPQIGEPGATLWEVAVDIDEHLAS